MKIYIFFFSQSFYLNIIFSIIFFRVSSQKLQILSIQITLSTILTKMETVKQSDQQIGIKQRISLYPLDINIPISPHFSKKAASSTLIHERDHLLATQRVNRSEGDKKLSDIKQFLSKSLFNKGKKKALIQKQKIRQYFCGQKLDNLPISPQTQQKSATNLLNFLRIKNNDNQQKPSLKKETKKNKTFKKDKDCQNKQDDSGLKISQVGYLNCNQQSQKDRNDIRQLLDEKFNNLLQMNYAEQGDLSIDIESQFTIKKPKRSKEQIDIISPCLVEDKSAIHQKLLQQENFYIRQQLITFTSIIETERAKADQYRSRAKALKKENAKLKSKNIHLESQFLQREENIYILSSQNSEYLTELKRLREFQSLLQSKFQTLLRQYELLSAKLHQLQQQKEKEVEIFIEQIKQKDKDILQLNEIILQLRAKVLVQQEKSKQMRQQKVNTSIQRDRINEEGNLDRDQEFQMSSSICLSLAEAQSLKNIIQEKEQMFQQGIETLKKINSENQQKYSKTIEQLQHSLQSIEKSKERQIQQLKQSFNMEIERLKSQNYQSSLVMNKQITEEQERKGLLISQIKLLERKLEQNLQQQQDDELEQLLQNCVNELEKERHTNFLLREQFSEERRANYLMRQEIEKLRRMFTKQLYLIQEIQERSYIN